MIISSSMYLRLMRMNSWRLSGVMIEKFNISIVMNLAPLVEITLLKRILATSISAVGVATSPG